MPTRHTLTLSHRQSSYCLTSQFLESRFNHTWRHSQFSWRFYPAFSTEGIEAATFPWNEQTIQIVTAKQESIAWATVGLATSYQAIPIQPGVAA